MSTFEDVRQQLRHQLDELMRRVEKIEGELRSLRAPDLVERATVPEVEKSLVGLAETSRADLQRTRDALGRLDTGRYGICTRCGGSIGEARLAALPTTDVCVGCVAKS